MDPVYYILSAIIVVLLIDRSVSSWAHRLHVDRLERLVKASTLQDFVASETILTRKPDRRRERQPPPPSLFDDMYGVGPRPVNGDKP